MQRTCSQSAETWKNDMRTMFGGILIWTIVFTHTCILFMLNAWNAWHLDTGATRSQPKVGDEWHTNTTLNSQLQCFMLQAFGGTYSWLRTPTTVAEHYWNKNQTKHCHKHWDKQTRNCNFHDFHNLWHTQDQTELHFICTSTAGDHIWDFTTLQCTVDCWPTRPAFWLNST
jgi:hypothetical protein